ncbi:hypothetical protein FISHEDRAFT_76469 [Fistulina hepatica ATCC 64428]|uniref:Uncharacterized protein n=1 Tax=Fistulina hepatica ATCC 64428 TaxID=1128425 RepID=A0A0D7A484_9AGAR|nr:hypothetical protein FISHEDRAFT_76469 [Fistulina hepatica ATCC 64428]
MDMDYDEAWCPVCDRQIKPKWNTVTIAPPTEKFVGGHRVIVPAKTRLVLDSAPLPLYCSDECFCADQVSRPGLIIRRTPNDTFTISSDSSSSSRRSRVHTPWKLDSDEHELDLSSFSSDASSSVESALTSSSSSTSRSQSGTESEQKDGRGLSPSMTTLAKYYNFPPLPACLPEEQPPPPPPHMRQQPPRETAPSLVPMSRMGEFSRALSMVNQASSQPSFSSSSAPGFGRPFSASTSAIASGSRSNVVDRHAIRRDAFGNAILPGWNDGSHAWRAHAYPTPETVRTTRASQFSSDSPVHITTFAYGAGTKRGSRYSVKAPSAGKSFAFGTTAQRQRATSLNDYSYSAPNGSLHSSRTKAGVTSSLTNLPHLSPTKAGPLSSSGLYPLTSPSPSDASHNSLSQSSRTDSLDSVASRSSQLYPDLASTVGSMAGGNGLVAQSMPTIGSTNSWLASDPLTSVDTVHTLTVPGQLLVPDLKLEARRLRRAAVAASRACSPTKGEWGKASVITGLSGSASDVWEQEQEDGDSVTPKGSKSTSPTSSPDGLLSSRLDTPEVDAALVDRATSSSDALREFARQARTSQPSSLPQRFTRMTSPSTRPHVRSPLSTGSWTSDEEDAGNESASEGDGDTTVTLEAGVDALRLSLSRSPKGGTSAHTRNKTVTPADSVVEGDSREGKEDGDEQEEKAGAEGLKRDETIKARQQKRPGVLSRPSWSYAQYITCPVMPMPKGPITEKRFNTETGKLDEVQVERNPNECKRLFMWE